MWDSFTDDDERLPPVPLICSCSAIYWCAGIDPGKCDDCIECECETTECECDFDDLFDEEE